MAHLKIPYETPERTGVFLDLEVPDENLWIQCIPREPDPIPNLPQAVEKAVESPVEGPKFSELLRRGRKVTFITENQFRAAPARDILPALVKMARQAGCELSIVIGCAALPPLNPEEIEEKLGPDLAKSGIPIFCNDVNAPEQFRFKGVTKAGTPLFVHQKVAGADVIVTISTTQATVWGYGGSGMIIPAVSGSETIELNHLMSISPDCIPGNNDCLMQRDKYEALEIVGVHMAVNVIVSNQGGVIFLNAGAPVISHKEAVRYYNQIYQFVLPELNQKKADIAIAGTSAVADHLFFHSGWAVANCDPVVRDGGIIMLATACPGYGDWPGFVRMDVLRPYLAAPGKNRVRALKDFYQQIVSGKKSFAWYKIYEVLARKDVWLVTDPVNLPLCKEIGLTAFASMAEAFSRAMDRCGRDAQVAFIPYGRYTIIKSGLRRETHGEDH
jgi:nickel-dependent lactate racemase